MPEAYTGVKFKTIFLNKEIVEDNKINELIKWGKKFAELSLSPKYDGGSAGNLSFRTKNGFIVTSSRSDLSSLNEEKFTEVIKCDFNKKKIYVRGIKEPSSESFLHYSIYKKREDINVIFHVHDDGVLKHAEEMKIPVTHNRQPSGTVELAEEVIKILKNYKYIILKEHGVVARGEAIDEVGKLVLEKFEEGKKLEN